MRQRALSILAAAALCLSLLPVPALAAAPDPSIVDIPDGLVIEGTVVTDYTGDATELTIPDGVTEIGSGAFSGNQTVERVTLPASVTTIGDHAFAYTYNLESIDMPGVTSIGDSAFSYVNSQGNTSSLTAVSMPEVTVIGKNAFEHAALTSVELPEATTIEQFAFFSCTALSSITIPKVETIGQQAFAFTGLTSFVVPDSATDMGASILAAAPLESLTISLHTLLNATFHAQTFDRIFPSADEYEIVLTGVDRDVTLLKDGIEADEKTVTFSVAASYEPFHITSVVEATGGTVTNQTGKTVTVNGTEVLHGSVKPVGVESDDYLSALALDGAALEPVFNNVTQAYTAAVDYTVEAVQVQAVPSDDGAAVTVNGTAAGAADNYTVTVPLQEGENTISVVVTSQDVTVSRTYTVTVTKNPVPENLVITTAQELMDFADAVNNGDYIGIADVTVELGGDIDMSGCDWTPIGVDENRYFSGTFEGNGHTIRNLTITKNATGYFGLFGYTTATIQNVNLTGSLTNTYTDSMYVPSIVGAIAGYLLGGTIRNCTTDFTITSENNMMRSYTGGIVGAAEDSTVVNCVSGTRLIGQFGEYVGGVVGGIVNGAQIHNCIYDGTITLTGTSNLECGGIVGDIYAKSEIPEVSYCINQGNIDASVSTSSIGGIAGGTYNGGFVHHCTNKGTITGQVNSIGGIIGAANGGTVENCLNLGSMNSTGEPYTGGPYAGGIAGYVSASASVSTCVSMGSVATVSGMADPIVFNVTNGAMLENNYYDTAIGTSANGIGKPAEEINTETFIETITALGGDYRLDGDGNIEIIPLSYTLTVEGSEAETTGAGEYEAGEQVTLDAGSRFGYAFAGWTATAGALADPDAAQTTFTMPAEDVTVTAAWTAVSSSGGSAAYSVTVADSDGGSVETSPARAARGRMVTLTVRPDEGYALDSLTASWSGGTLSLTDRGDGTYTFTMPRGGVTVRALFAAVEPEEPETPQLPFDDVAADDWFYDAVAYVYEAGLMEGASASAFRPEALTTRAMAAQILYRLEGGPDGSAAAAFPDVAAGSWYADAVDWAADSGVILGYDSGLFGPEDPVTREQLVTMLYRYARYKGLAAVTTEENLGGFADGDEVSPYAVQAVNWAVGRGLLTGKEGGRLDPGGYASRVELAALLQRFAALTAE